MDWDSITIANLHLTMAEHLYYDDIFSYCCENSDSESVPVIKVAELLRSANLPGVVTMKVNYTSNRYVLPCQLLIFSPFCNQNAKAMRYGSLCRSGRSMCQNVS